MPLFQQSVIKKYIADLDKEKLANAWKVFQSHFADLHKQENIRNAKEEQYQEGFLRELFVDVFGYTLNPQPHFNLTTEYKNEKDSKKADGAVLKEGAVRAVIELKGTDIIDLSRVESQAFNYLHNQKGCTYVITSNFEKLRFYIQDATEFEEFNLFTLTAGQFTLLYLCLQKDSLLQDVPLQIKQQSLAQEDAITKKLYSDYSTFKNALYQNLVQNNQQYNKLELFKKTQKLLDRFLFILFAEDRLLLPPNFIIKIVDDWKQLQKLRISQSLYDRFKLYFTDLLQGNSNEDIFAYNGGLFEPDDVLDNLLIDDDLLANGVLKLSNYDYNTEVDVNILGHIFEHSLNEIEEIQASIAQTTVEKTKTRRKKEGVFYTPRYITKYIVENTVGALCKEKKEALQIIEEDYAPAVKKTKASEVQRRTLVQKLDDYRNWLLNVTICDPACGSGAFLNAALEFLIAEHNYIDELTNKLMGSGTLGFRWTPNDILEHNLFGVDINEEAVEIARLSLWLRTAQKGRKLSNLSDKIKCGNSLIDDETVAGDKAFTWKEEFKTVFDKGGFDVVIGNPPYGATVLKIEKNYFSKNYLTTLVNYDTYGLFFEKAWHLVKTNGFLSYITPNTYLVLENGEAIRKFLFERFSIKSLLETYNVFEDAVVEPITTIFRNKKPAADNEITSFISNRKIKKLFDKNDFLENRFKQEDLFDRKDLIFNYRATLRERQFLKEIENKSEKLGDIAKVTAGVKPYEKGKGNPSQTEEIVLRKPYTGHRKVDDNWFKLIRGTQVVRYVIGWDGEFIKYGEWLAAPRNANSFFKPKIVIRRTDDRILASYDDSGYIGLNSIHCLQVLNSALDLKYILSIINSRLLEWYFQIQNFHMVGKPLAEVKVVFIERLPIIITNNQQPFISKAETMLSKNKDLQQLKQNLLQLLSSKYEEINISKRLLNWTELSFKEFLKELEKQKINLSLTQQPEWLQYFESEKSKAIEIQNVIKETDKEIDNMVYALYSLTDEEIKIVEEE